MAALPACRRSRCAWMARPPMGAATGSRCASRRNTSTSSTTPARCCAVRAPERDFPDLPTPATRSFTTMKALTQGRYVGREAEAALFDVGQGATMVVRILEGDIGRVTLRRRDGYR